MEMRKPAAVGSIYSHCADCPGGDMDGGERGLRPGSWAQLTTWTVDGREKPA